MRESHHRAAFWRCPSSEEVAMKSKVLGFGFLLLASPTVLILDGCGKVQADANVGAPPPATVIPAVNVTLFSVDNPEQFPFVTATEHPSTSELIVTGTVNPDVSRSVPVVSLAAGRVVAIHARLGD